MDDAKPIYLHAGAHRTGSSSFQMMLAENRAEIAAAGFDLAYPGRDGAPGGTLRLRLPNPRNLDRVETRFIPAVAEALAAHDSDAAGGLILSEENLPGAIQPFTRGRFYPAAEARFDVFARGAARPVARLVFVVRDYAELFVSSFRKRAEDNLVAPFHRFRPRMMRMDRGWPDVIAAMRDRLAPRDMIVLDYARRGRSVDLLRRLVPALSEVPLREPDRVANLSATDAALEALQARYATGEELSRADWQAVIEDHRDDDAARGFAEFRPGQLSRLRARYAVDLERIAGMPGVTFLGEG